MVHFSECSTSNCNTATQIEMRLNASQDCLREVEDAHGDAPVLIHIGTAIEGGPTEFYSGNLTILNAV